MTETFLAQHSAKVHLVNLSGSVEIMIGLGVADAIVDLVETGSTLAANQLRILTDIGSYETVLVQNPRTKHAATCDRVVRRLEGSRYRSRLFAAGIQRPQKPNWPQPKQLPLASNHRRCPNWKTPIGAR